MPELITLTEDGPLGQAGTQVWVDDPADIAAPKPAKTAARPRQDGRATPPRRPRDPAT